MIQKILSSEYLRRIDNMECAEREAYLKRVEEWLRKQAPLLTVKMQDSLAVFQNAVQLSTGWNDTECQAWSDGARLLTAMSGKADTWLPDMLYTKSAKRCIHKMVNTLQAVGTKPAVPQDTQQVAKEEPAEGTSKATQAVAAIPVRPTHIDQYVHLLPQKTQEKAATVKGLLRDLDVAREKMRLLADDPNANSSSRAQWAKTAATLDAKVKAVYKELDAEWEKLVQSGRVVVDDLGNARVMPAAEATEKLTETVGLMKQAQTEVKAQIKSLRSWLRDTRGPKEDGDKKDAYVARWKEKYQEMVRLGGKDTVTEAVAKAAELYGIKIDEITT